MLSSILIQGTGASLAVGPVVLCTVVSLALGVAAVSYTHLDVYKRQDLVQFGLVMVINLTIGLLTPPVGTAMYVGSNVSGVPIPQISRALLPFIAIMLGVLMIVTYVPAFTGWAY